VTAGVLREAFEGSFGRIRLFVRYYRGFCCKGVWPGCWPTGEGRGAPPRETPGCWIGIPSGWLGAFGILPMGGPGGSFEEALPLPIGGGGGIIEPCGGGSLGAFWSILGGGGIGGLGAFGWPIGGGGGNGSSPGNPSGGLFGNPVSFLERNSSSWGGGGGGRDLFPKGGGWGIPGVAVRFIPGGGGGIPGGGFHPGGILKSAGGLNPSGGLKSAGGFHPGGGKGGLPVGRVPVVGGFQPGGGGDITVLFGVLSADPGGRGGCQPGGGGWNPGGSLNPGGGCRGGVIPGGSWKFAGGCQPTGGGGIVEALGVVEYTVYPGGLMALLGDPMNPGVSGYGRLGLISAFKFSCNP
jgi:hypothetical protein